MTTTQEALGIRSYSTLSGGEETRLVAAVQGLERALPGLRLEWTVSDEHQLVHLPQRDAWLLQAMKDRRIPFVCNNDENHPATLSALEISANSAPGGQPLLDVHADLPLTPEVIAASAQMVEVVAEATQALWGEATPFRAAVDIARQTSRTLAGPPSPPRGLPALKLPAEIRSPEIPHRLGWLNYWSATAARAIGFPDPDRDAELLSLSRSTATGGWIVRLTEAPLDFENPGHLEVVLRAYERFPEIGGHSRPSRSSKRSPPP
ncbi:DUF5953 family protein [Corallococcus terminator]|uniref:Uncharacterized protein n=1 Tax=Corallococcus terminator TaxID=2316733 RepID=A0A3A8JUU8_9BACT|nr:DUF5953 family protein [Corallococcus terminator]RKG94141.1 hypothetical protein D7V88_00015 [Corallococcus terminator]